MLTAAVLIVFVLVVAGLSRWTSGTRIAPRSCCSMAPWPPDDLSGFPLDAEALTDADAV